MKWWYFWNRIEVYLLYILQAALIALVAWILYNLGQIPDIVYVPIIIK